VHRITVMHFDEAPPRSSLAAAFLYILDPASLRVILLPGTPVANSMYTDLNGGIQLP
jgi:hypothetical protein